VSADLSLVIEPDLRIAEERICCGLKEFNTKALGECSHLPLVVTLRDADREVRAGIVGGVHLGWLNVDSLWVEERLRGQGYGSELLAQLESLSLSHGASRAFLDTMEFQAVGFYLRRGYVEFGRISDFARGFDRVFLQKALIDEHSTARQAHDT
jgi:GNAT superfamily N-acetyltransferase